MRTISSSSHHTGQNSASFTMSQFLLLCSVLLPGLASSGLAKRDTLLPVHIEKLGLKSLIVIFIWTLNHTSNQQRKPCSSLSDLRRVWDWLIPLLRLKHRFHWNTGKRHEPGSEIRRCYEPQSYKQEKKGTWIWKKKLGVYVWPQKWEVTICTFVHLLFLCGVEWSGL